MANPIGRGPGQILTPSRGFASPAWVTTKSYWKAQLLAPWLSGPPVYLAERGWANPATWNLPAIAPPGFGLWKAWKPETRFRFNGSIRAEASFASEPTSWTT